MNNINIEATVEMCVKVNIPIIASGGIANIEDIKTLCEAAQDGIMGAITGRAIYEGTLDFAEAQQLADTICTYTPKE